MQTREPAVMASIEVNASLYDPICGITRTKMSVITARPIRPKRIDFFLSSAGRAVAPSGITTPRSCRGATRRSGPSVGEPHSRAGYQGPLRLCKEVDPAPGALMGRGQRYLVVLRRGQHHVRPGRRCCCGTGVGLAEALRSPSHLGQDTSDGRWVMVAYLGIGFWKPNLLQSRRSPREHPLDPGIGPTDRQRRPRRTLDAGPASVKHRTQK